jgi:hypothetical protein
MITNSSYTARLATVALAALVVAAVPRNTAAQPAAQPQPGFVTIEQAGHNVAEKHGEVTLARAPFTIVLAMPSSTVVMARVSRTSRVFDLARSGQSLLGPFADGGGLAEGLRNGDESVFLVDSDEPAFHYWFYDSNTNNRFDSVQVSPRGIIARRTVSHFSARGESLRPLAMFPGRSMYFVFRLVDGSKRELSRAALRVTFADEETGVPDEGAEAVATVGSRAIALSTFRTAYLQAAQAYQNAYSGQIKTEDLRGLGLHLQVLQRLVDDQVILLEAERLGVKVTDEQVMARIQSLPAFQAKGRFVGAKRYAEMLAAEHPPLTPETFMEAMRFSLTEEALQQRVGRHGGTQAEQAAAFRGYLDGARSSMKVMVFPELIADVVDGLK